MSRLFLKLLNLRMQNNNFDLKIWEIANHRYNLYFLMKITTSVLATLRQILLVLILVQWLNASRIYLNLYFPLQFVLLTLRNQVLPPLNPLPVSRGRGREWCWVVSIPLKGVFRIEHISDGVIYLYMCVSL